MGKALGKMSRRTSEPVPAVFPDDTSHYHFRISLRVRHPEADPERITNALRMTPKRAWKAGAPAKRQLARHFKA